MENFRIVVVGPPGSGKSTLIGRLLHETGFLPQNISHRISKSKMTGRKEEFALAVEQLAKDDVTGVPQIEFKTYQRSYNFIIPANRKEFLKSTVAEAIEADVAILVIDASQGLLNQAYQYAYLLDLLGIKEIIIVVNKMDLKLYSRIGFWEISEEIADFLKKLRMYLVSSVPVSAQHGDNIIAASSRMNWNTSSTPTKALGRFSAPKSLALFPLRLIIQSPYLTDNKIKFFAKVASGKLFVGNRLTFSPTHYTTKVLSINISGQERISAGPGESVILVLEDTNYLERGQIGFNICHSPLTMDFLITKVFWIGDKSLKPDDKIDILCGTNCCTGYIEKISEITYPACPEANFNYIDQLAESQVANVRIKLDSPICIDLFIELPALGKFAIAQDGKITGGGIFK